MKAIPIFKEVHPGCQALFFIYQSSAHAALPPNTLKAFEMNKSNGRKQHCQKGSQQTLEEHGFNVTGKCAKCSPVCP